MMIGTNLALQGVAASRRAGSAGGLPLDSYKANLYSALSVRKLITSYSGPCIRVRRSSDSAEQDIGFAGGGVDTAALLAFVGAGNGFVRTIYDQSGAGNHFVQTASAAQPRVVNSGIFDGKLVFDGTDDGLVSLNTSGVPAALFVYLRGKLRSTAASQMLIEHGSNWSVGSGNNMAAYWNGAGGLEVGMSELGLGNRSLGIYAGLSPNDNVHAYALDRAGETYDTSAYVFVGGVKQARSSSNNAAFKPTGVFTDLSLNVGFRSDGSHPATLDLRDMAIFNAAQSDLLVSAISGSIA